MHALLITITDIGDSAVLAGVVACGSGYLAWTGNGKAAAILAGALLAAGAAIGFLKIAFIGCNLRVLGLDIHVPSGHVALSTAVLGTLVMLVGTRLAPWPRVVVYAGIGLLVGAIAATRVLLHAHSVDEVIVGFLVGGAVAAASHFLIRHLELPPVRLRGLAVATLATAVLLNGVRLPAEDVVRWLAALVATRTAACQLASAAATPAQGSLAPRPSRSGVL